jgi:hypothetical protein
MKRLLPYILCLPFLLGFRYVPEILYVTAKEGLMLRSGPDRKATPIALLGKGTILKVVGLDLTPDGADKLQTIDGVSGHWYKVEYGKKTGWAFGGYMRDPQMAFMEAARMNDQETMTEELKFGAKPNMRIYGGDTALLWAAENPDPSSITFLLQFSPGVDVKNDALLRAITKGNSDSVRTLLQAGASPNAFSPTSNMVLLSAIRLGKTESVRLLLEFGANANASDTFGDTPMKAARAKGLPEIIKLLLAAGAR